MNQEIYENLRMGFETAYIDSRISSNIAFKPQFVSNNHQEGKKVISSIEDELLSCDKFQISVAFITMSDSSVNGIPSFSRFGPNTLVCTSFQYSNVRSPSPSEYA